MLLRSKRIAGGLAIGAVLATPATARATGFTDTGEDIVRRDTTAVKLEGYLRTRAEALYNLDLDRGLTPSGQSLFPVPLGDPNGQTLTYADMRLRTDLAVYAPFGGVAVKARVDWLDNIPLGGNASGIPSASTTQLSPGNAVVVKRAYGEALTPVGLLAAGRMGNQWGLGMVANGGDCADCDSGDAADRVAFITPLAGHIWAAAYDWSASGPFVPRNNGARLVDVAPTAAVRSLTFAMMRYRDDFARQRRRIAGKTTIEYGAYLAHRWQSGDVPATYLPTAQPIPITDTQVMSRGFTGTVFDAWARVTHPWFRIEAEWAYAVANVDQPSLVPGVLFHDPVTSHQHGGALESEVGSPDTTFGVGIDAGYASGDPSPGFGAFPKVGAPAAKPGDLDGAQANPPYSNHVDNFRFHPDYRIDRILFREIIGTVTDAVYVRPHARAHLVRTAAGALTASVAAVQSWAAYASSAPGEKSPLGVEIDPTLAWGSRDGFGAALEYAVLFPLAGLDNPAQHLLAKPAQLARVRLMYRF
jgi:uncharacterized protein (TIGR04551 family)